MPWPSRLGLASLSRRPAGASLLRSGAGASPWWLSALCRRPLSGGGVRLQPPESQVVKETSHNTPQKATEAFNEVRSSHHQSKFLMLLYNKRLSVKAEHDAHRSSCFDQLQKMVKKRDPDLVLMPFGSSVTTLCTRDTDLDVAIVRPLPASREDALERLRGIRRGLRQCNVRLIEARTPIVKKDGPSKHFPYNFDISFGTEGVVNSHWLRQYVLRYPEFRPLSMFIKRWSKAWSLNDSSKGRMHSYMLNLMLIHFLCQVKAIEYLPPTPIDLETVQPYPAFVDLPVDRVPWKDIPALLRRFLDFYAQWPAGRVVGLSVSPLDGPVAAAAKGWEQYPFCVEDPFRTDFNVALNIDAKTWAQLQARFAAAAHCCKTDLRQLFWLYAFDGQLKPPPANAKSNVAPASPEKPAKNNRKPKPAEPLPPAEPAQQPPVVAPAGESPPAHPATPPPAAASVSGAK
eukprot:EG_transcript_12268